MSKFIVWTGKSFYKDCSYSYLTLKQDGKIYEEENDDYGGSSSKETSYKPLFAIGKQDINGQEIYADCSIFEFELIDKCLFDDFTGKKPTILNKINMKGYFVFNNEELRYEIEILDRDKSKTKSQFICLYFNFETMNNFKIIDTIQENKLGLVK